MQIKRYRFSLVLHNLNFGGPDDVFNFSEFHRFKVNKAIVKIFSSQQRITGSKQHAMSGRTSNRTERGGQKNVKKTPSVFHRSIKQNTKLDNFTLVLHNFSFQTKGHASHMSIYSFQFSKGLLNLS
uniref:Uncharacterized protein n=1 Tax=Opuntia streptacantha TaxID=393608 RepID=A0A7C8Z2K9_OPUST